MRCSRAESRSYDSPIFSLLFFLDELVRAEKRDIIVAKRRGGERAMGELERAAKKRSPATGQVGECAERVWGAGYGLDESE